MIRRTLEVSRQPAHLCLHHEQLVLKRGEEIVGSLPCEDVGMVVVDHPQATYTHAALARLLEAGAAVVICGSRHLPAGLLIPLPDHTEVVWRLDAQARTSLPLKKRLWQQVVRAKIQAQAANLAPGSPTATRLLGMAEAVRSGDAGAHESQAAKLYWQAWLTEVPENDLPPWLQAAPADTTPKAAETPVSSALSPFRRDVDGDGLNALLNYGYAIMRAAVARSLVAAGLHPALGIQHRNRGNAFCLADDLLEPLRPLVDRRARWLWLHGQRELDQPTKAALLELLDLPVLVRGRRGPLQVALHHYAASFLRCLKREETRLAFPRAARDGTAAPTRDDPQWNSIATDPCGS